MHISIIKKGTYLYLYLLMENQNGPKFKIDKSMMTSWSNTCVGVKTAPGVSVMSPNFTDSSLGGTESITAGTTPSLVNASITLKANFISKGTILDQYYDQQCLPQGVFPSQTKLPFPHIICSGKRWDKHSHHGDIQRRHMVWVMCTIPEELSQNKDWWL